MPEKKTKPTYLKLAVTKGYKPPGDGEDYPTPRAGWDARINLDEKNFLLHYRRFGNKAAAARSVGRKGDAGPWSRARFLTKKVQDAWMLLNDKDPIHRKCDQPIIDAVMGVDHEKPPAEEVAEKAPIGFRTMAGKRLLQEARKTPLDVMVQTMLDLYLEAEQHMVQNARGNSIDSAESLALKREACEVAKDAAPYMHSRLTAVEAKVTSNLEELSDKQLDEKLSELSKRLGTASMATTNPDAFAVPGIVANGTGGEDDDEDGLPPVH